MPISNYLPAIQITFILSCFILATLTALGVFQVSVPSGNIKLAEIVEEPQPEITITVVEPAVEPVKKEQKRKPKPKKKTKKKTKKKNEKLSRLKEDCILALKSLGVKKSEASSEVERIFKKDKNIKSVEEFLRSMV